MQIIENLFNKVQCFIVINYQVLDFQNISFLMVLIIN
jgi:hypothetical protein